MAPFVFLFLKYHIITGWESEAEAENFSRRSIGDIQIDDVDFSFDFHFDVG